MTRTTFNIVASAAVLSVLSCGCTPGSGDSAANTTASNADAVPENVAAGSDPSLPVAATAPAAAPTAAPTVVAPAAYEAATIAVFRYLMASVPARATACAGIGERPYLADPAPALLATLGRQVANLAPASTCKAGTEARDAAGRPATIFNVQGQTCPTATECLFRGGSYQGNVGAVQGSYRARLANGRWTVAPDGPQIAS